MDDLDRQLLASHPHWQQVLEAYLEQTAESAGRPVEETGPRWSDRIVSINDLEPEELSSIHGQLIALGWLKFQFEAGQSGLMYRVSSAGRALLKFVRRPDSESPLATDLLSEENDDADDPSSESSESVAA